MSKVYLLIGFICLSFLPVLAQLPIVNSSLKSRIKNQDSLSVNSLNQQCWTLRRTDPLTAIKIGKESLEIAQEIGYGKGATQVMNYLGVCYLRLDDSRNASYYFFKALTFSDSLKLDLEKGYALNNIASSLLFEGEYRQALGYAQKSLALQSRNNNKKGVAYSWVRMSEIYFSLQKYDSLLITAQTAYQLLKELKMQENALVALKNIGRAWEGKKQYHKALNCYMEIVNSTTISQVTVNNVYADLARVYNLLKLPDQAIFYGEKWLSSEKGNDLILGQLAEAYAQKQNWKYAFQFARMSILVRDSLLKEERFRQIKNLQILYETRETEKENANLKMKLNIKNLVMLAFIFIIFLIGLLVIILLSKRNQQIRLNKILNKQNEEIGIQRDHLTELNQTKDKLFSIIAHDLRGPIGSTFTFLELLTANEVDFTKKELVENLNVIKDSSKATFKLLENLLTWSRSQKGEIEFKPTQNNLFKLVQSNIDLFASNAENKKIRISNELDPNISFEFDKEMINTVIRNLINNSIKYTRENGQITISAKEINDCIEISVHDTGIGMNSDAAEVLFLTNNSQNRKDGTRGERGTGLGLLLCKEFVGKHNGKIWAESKPDEGSTFKFTLPCNKKETKVQETLVEMADKQA